jgi:hypothetical protein
VAKNFLCYSNLTVFVNLFFYISLFFFKSGRRFHEIVKNQAVETAAAPGCCKKPAHVRQTVCADGNPSIVSRKPGKFIRGCSGCGTTRGLLKTPDFKHNAVRIGKGMVMGAVDNNPLSGPGDKRQALPAKQGRRLVRSRFWRAFLLYMPVGFSVKPGFACDSSFLSRRSKIHYD